MNYQRDYNVPRDATIAILEGIAEGLLDPQKVLEAALGWLSDRDVEEMAFANAFFEVEDEEEEEENDPLDNFNYVGSRHHY